MLPNNVNVVYFVIIYFIDSANFRCVFDMTVYVVHFSFFVCLNTLRTVVFQYHSRVLMPAFSKQTTPEAAAQFEKVR
jgi:hypothetical protein